MDDSLHHSFIAIDGGGTSCRFALRLSTGVVTVRRGSANVFSAPEAALQTLNDGLAELAAQAGLDKAQLAGVPLYAGLAGVADDAIAQFVADRLPSRQVLIEDDRRAAVIGALGGRAGCLIGIGTGSFLARQSGDAITFIGGYGAVLGDEASASWLGKGLLRRALHVLDGLEASSDLVEACLDEFQHKAARIVRFTVDAQPADYGVYAPQVVQAAKAGDEAGRTLMTTGAGYIGKALRAMDRRPGESICAIGGVAAHYTEFLPPDVAADMVEPQGEALDGAMELARRFAVQIQQEQA
ncbi:hypothetical protein A9Q94_05910 [Rhodobacterales bacterium 56_14_T64]|nr:hypothetical protein A9Q94_05910 [Rhodobacterales bacterium 56_14_T64]